MHGNVFSVHCEEELVGYASLLVGYGFWGDFVYNAERKRNLKKLRFLGEIF